MTKMRYISTRGQAPALSFDDAVLAGLASDGGLYVPETIPQFSSADIAAMRGLSYTELAFKIIAPFTGGSIPDAVLKKIIDESYKNFRDKAVAPLKQVDGNIHVLELFHGPTLAFKDFALQFLGRLLDYILDKRGSSATIVGATSGDTGSAAIAGCQGRKHMEIFILHPKGRVSDVQRRQMTSVMDANVHNIALEGTFDDCQDIVKTLFADKDFREKHRLSAVNSINWARIVAQIVYYFYAGLQLGAPEKAVNFSVPTGNFGDIFAGYMARRMGLPIAQLIIASNRNDILTRCLHTGTYSAEDVVPSLSPSMDIQVSSNFERLLFDLYDRDGNGIRNLMQQFREKKSFTLSADAWGKLKTQFAAHAVDDDATKRTIADTYSKHGYLLDPHTAVGYAAALQCDADPALPMIVLATAHPAKFPDAVKSATGTHPALPAHLSDLLERKERFDVLRNDIAAVKTFIEQHSQ